MSINTLNEDAGRCRPSHSFFFFSCPLSLCFFLAYGPPWYRVWQTFTRLGGVQNSSTNIQTVNQYMAPSHAHTYTHTDRHTQARWKPQRCRDYFSFYRLSTRNLFFMDRPHHITHLSFFVVVFLCVHGKKKKEMNVKFLTSKEPPPPILRCAVNALGWMMMRYPLHRGWIGKKKMFCVFFFCVVCVCVCAIRDCDTRTHQQPAKSH